MEEIKEKLQEHENKMNILKEIIEKGFKRIENPSLRSEKFSGGLSASKAAEDTSETNKGEMIHDDGTKNKTGPELPQPVSDFSIRQTRSIKVSHMAI